MTGNEVTPGASIAPEETARILASFFQTFLHDEGECAPDIRPPAEAFGAGQFVPRVRSRLYGSFTQRGVPETLYVISVGECHAFGGGRSLVIAVVNDGGVGADVVDGVVDVARTVDLDGDGRMELVLTGSGLAQGVVEESAEVVRLGAEGLTTVEDLGVVSVDTCLSDLPSREKRLTTVTGCGAPPRFSKDERTSACR
jgi:hypothetical protein